MTNQYTKSVVAEFLKAKLAEEQMPMPQPEEAHEAAETPQQEMLEHAGGAGEGEEGHPEGGHSGAMDEVEHLLSQLSPEELEHLAQQLSADHEGGEHPHEGGEEDLGGLSQEIEQHLAQNPEAAVEGAAPEKAAALNFVKSASYIEGFLNQAVSQGASVKQAVDLYDEALTDAVGDLQKEALAAKAKAPSFSSRVSDYASRGKELASEGYAKAKKYVKKNPYTTGGVALAGAGAGALLARGSKDDEKKAAYFEGLFERAAEYGLDKAAAAEFIQYSDLEKTARAKAKAPSFSSRVSDYASRGKELASEGYAKAKKYVKKNPYTTGGVALGGAAATAGVGMALSKKNKDEEDTEKKAAYLEGIYKRALAYGYSEQEASAFVENALNS